MNRLNLNFNLSFEEMKKNIEAFQTQYIEFLASFSYFEKKRMLTVKKELKKQIFACQSVPKWKLERFWECLNGDLEIEKFKNLK